MRVAIVGLASTTHHLAPWDDPSWEIWGLPWDEGYWPRMARLFEMHDLRLLESPMSRRPEGYMERLRSVDVPLYMQEAYPSIPNAQAYPYAAVASITGAYWNSSIAYAFALALAEGATELAVYGVDMVVGDEYAYQRPNMEYLIGMARGMGIPVSIPDASPLCKFAGEGIRFGNGYPVYQDRYGWLG